MMTDLPQFALSIRQPWAWAIINAGKDIENRDWTTKLRGPVCIHAGLRGDNGISDDMIDTIQREAVKRGVRLPPTADCLGYGGIIGVADIVDCVEASASPWFFGRYGFVLRNVRPVEFIPVKGALGFFDWRKRMPSND